MSRKFEPCPFCNSGPMIHEGDLATCSCIRGMEEMYVDDWNTRPIEAALRAELIDALEEIAGTPPEALWEMETTLDYVSIQVDKKDYMAARKRLEELKNG